MSRFLRKSTRRDTRLQARIQDFAEVAEYKRFRSCWAKVISFWFNGPDSTCHPYLDGSSVSGPSYTQVRTWKTSSLTFSLSHTAPLCSDRGQGSHAFWIHHRDNSFTQNPETTESTAWKQNRSRNGTQHIIWHGTSLPVLKCISRSKRLSRISKFSPMQHHLSQEHKCLLSDPL